MAEILLFHHAQGRTSGVHAFAETLRAAGHAVHVPDLYDGVTFNDLDAGVAHAQKALGLDEIMRRGESAADTLSRGLVYAGFSLGAMAAQALTQGRPGARGALLLHGGVPADTFDRPWPAGVPLQIHAMEGDEWAEVPVLRDLAAEVAGAELCLYPGTAHLFTDNSLGEYDEAATRLVTQRILAFLDRVA